MQLLTERTAELEWLFNLTGNLRGAADDREVVKELLQAATVRLESELGMLIVPERRMLVEFVRDGTQGVALQRMVSGMRNHLLTWAQRHRKPLVINAGEADDNMSARCKILAVPVLRDGGRVIGLMAFFNPREAADFGNR